MVSVSKIFWIFFEKHKFLFISNKSRHFSFVLTLVVPDLNLYLLNYQPVGFFLGENNDNNNAIHFLIVVDKKNPFLMIQKFNGQNKDEKYVKITLSWVWILCRLPTKYIDVDKEFM